MAPQSRPQGRHSGSHHSTGRSANNAPDAPEDGAVDDELFLDPMLGTPLAIYIEKDVADRDQLVEIITKYGGAVSPGYSGVPYILVDPHKESGQSLYRQYAGKKGKIVLDARWVHECVRAKELQTFHTNWAGCKVTGNEQIGVQPAPAAPSIAPAPDRSPIAPRRGRPPGSSSRTHAPAPPIAQPPQPQAHQPHQPHQTHQTHQPHQPQPLPSFAHPQSLQAPQAQAPPQVMHPGSIPPSNFPFPVYPSQTPQHPGGRSTLQAPPSAPPQTWQAPNGLPAHVPHPQMIAPRPPSLYGREEQWDGPGFPHLESNDASNTLPAINGGAADGYYDQRYRNDQNGWPDNTPNYYDQSQYVSAYPQEQPHQQQQQPEPAFISPIPGSSSQAQEATVPSNTGAERQQRGRKRTRTQPPPAPPASTLVLNRRHPPARSPTPPTRVIKSTYGGNLFTADDVMYLKKYIDYCQEQGLVLSLREICERIAVKAPHHTFYSWRRYCNKHQIRLGGYAMDIEGNNNRSVSPGEQNEPVPPVMGMGQVQGGVHAGGVQGMQSLGQTAIPGIQGTAAPKGNGPFTVNAAMRQLQEAGMRPRSPTPPRALFRSTTGKGVAFTDEDVAFLCKMLAHRKLQGRLDMVTFWKDVASKAQHHSRASWMKYYRRHKHELNRVEGDEPLPAPPAKKMRYGKNDDVLLAKYFANKPEGTSDKIFQEFAKIHPHHPWKGWQEHHRIHKAKIDHLIQRINGGETIEVGEDDD